MKIEKMSVPANKATKKGRPLSFDREHALQQAMLLFWRHGYEATSLTQLTAAMGITPPSLYAAFGDKKTLFRESVNRYLSGPVTAESMIANAASAHDAARQLLLGAVIGFTGTQTPPGCLLASSAISCSEAANDIQTELAAIRGKIELCLRNKIAHAVKSGELATTIDADAYAGHTMAVIQGLSTLARDGASREKLMGIVEIAMCAWPA